MCSWISPSQNEISLCILVTEFNSSAIIPAIIHIQDMGLLTGLARTNNRRLFLFTALVYVRAKLVVYQEDYTVEILFVLRIHFLVFYLFFSYSPASEGGITVMIVLYTCSQAAI